MRNWYILLVSLLALPYDGSAQSVEFTSLPVRNPYSFGTAQGQVHGVDVTNYGVALFIDFSVWDEYHNWWTKPFFNAPITSIQTNGTFYAPIITGGSDSLSETVAAYVVPLDYNIPLVSSAGSIPAEIESNSIAKVIADRPNDGSSFAFAGFPWTIEESYWINRPGDNYFTPNAFTPDVPLLDGQGRMRLVIRHFTNDLNDEWLCSEAWLADSLGYGTYRFSIGTDVSQFPDPLVLGLFLRSNDSQYHHRELGMMFSNGATVGSPDSWQYAI